MAKIQKPKTPKLVGKITKIEKKVITPKAVKQVAAKAIKQPAVKPKNMVPVKRVRQISDSLIEKAGLKFGAGDMRNEINKDKAGAQRLYRDAWAYIDRAERYKRLADKAVKNIKKK